MEEGIRGPAIGNSFPDIWVALPDSLLSEGTNLKDKTIKVGQIGRACAIFCVKRIYIYGDGYERDFKVTRLLLEYMETPQYLRRRAYGYRAELKFAGLLPPLKTPHHKPEVEPEKIRPGEYREGIVVKEGGRLYVDVGLTMLVPLEGVATEGGRVTVKFREAYPTLRCEVAKREGAGEYWGYEVRRAPSLGKLVKSAKADTTVFTSRKGRPLEFLWQDFVKRVRASRSLILVFGSPRRGVFEILADEKEDPLALSQYVMNMFPRQGTESVRTEEAVLGALAIVRLASSL